MADSIYDKLSQVSAKEVAASLTGGALSPEQAAAADVDGDGDVDSRDVELLADAQLKLANKISGAIVGMEGLTDAEQRVADRNGDGYANLTDSQRLADDAREAKRAAARHQREG